MLPSISRKQHGFSSVFAKRMSKNTEFCQIFGKRMQEAQASKKAGRGNRAWDPCFATPAPRRLRVVERHQIAAQSLEGGGPPRSPPPTYQTSGGGGVRGGGYPLSSLRCPTRRAMSADFPWTDQPLQCFYWFLLMFRWDMTYKFCFRRSNPPSTCFPLETFTSLGRVSFWGNT